MSEQIIVKKSLRKRSRALNARKEALDEALNRMMEFHASAREEMAIESAKIWDNIREEHGLELEARYSLNNKTGRIKQIG